MHPGGGDSANAQPSCWSVALERFKETSVECNTANEEFKTLLSLVLTKCHFLKRGKTKHDGFPFERELCNLDKAFELLKKPDEKSTEGSRKEGIIVMISIFIIKFGRRFFCCSLLYLYYSSLCF